MKLKVVGIIFLGTLLSGCIAAVVASATGLVVYDKRGVVTLEKDARIFHVVHTAIVKDPEFRGSRILVTSFNKVALLVGQTPTASLRMKAEKIAQNAPGVYRVYDEITVSYPLPYSQRSKDSLITSEVRTLMLTKKNLESGSIRIVTENGIVYLMGVVTPDQGDLAVDVARRVKGVRKVVKIFQYIH